MTNRLKRGGRWITGIEPGDAFVDAGKAIVGARLEPVPAALDLADRRHLEDVEHIHQLRVATRRADSAMVVFRNCFGPGRWKKVRQRLKRIRRAAGDARTCDVHLMMFEALLKQGDERDDAALREAIKRTRKDRDRAQKDVHASAARYLPRKLERSIGKLLDSARAPVPVPAEAAATATGNGHASKAGAPLTVIDVAHRKLPHFMEDVDEAAGRDLSIFENLHELRLKAKGLRYAMEIFAPCFPPEFRAELYPEVKALQDRLGAINDAHEIAHRLERFAQESSAADDLLQLAGAFRTERDTLVTAFLTSRSSSGSEGFGPRLDAMIHAGPAPVEPAYVE